MSCKSFASNSWIALLPASAPARTTLMPASGGLLALSRPDERGAGPVPSAFVAGDARQSGSRRALLASARNATGTDRASPADPSGSDRQPLEARPCGLTATQWEILTLLADGLSNREIAARRGIRKGTVKIHVNAIYQRLGVHNRIQAALVARQLDGFSVADVESNAPGIDALDWLSTYVPLELRCGGDVLFRRGDRDEALYVVRHGRIRLTEAGVEMTDGELLGDIGVFSPGHRRRCTAVCLTDAQLWRLNARQAHRLYCENPWLAFELTRSAVERLLVEREGAGPARIPARTSTALPAGAPPGM